MLALKLDLAGSISDSLRFVFSAGELPQGVFGKDATAEFDPFVHQLKQHVLGFDADRRYVLRGNGVTASERLSFEQGQDQLKAFGIIP